MLCEKCQQKTAHVHMTQISNNEKKEMYLCEECAAKIGNDTPISFQDFFKGLIDMAMEIEANNKEVHKKVNQVCQTCGLTYKEFRLLGKLGCSDCYDTFTVQMPSILKSIHGSSVHTGKLPQKSGVELLKKRQLETLKSQLSKAILEEEYELAAEYRDKIRSLEKGAEANELV